MYGEGTHRTVIQPGNLSAQNVVTLPTATGTLALTSEIPTTASAVGAVPTSRTVNGKSLSANITLTAADIGAATTADITAAIGNAIAASY